MNALKLCLLCVSVSLTGCAGSLVDAQRQALAGRYGADVIGFTYEPSARCQSLSDRHARSSNWAQALAYVAGGSGVTTIPAEELPEDYQGPARYTAAGVAVATGALAAWFANDAANASEQFELECLR